MSARWRWFLAEGQRKARIGFGAFNGEYVAFAHERFGNVHDWCFVVHVEDEGRVEEFGAKESGAISGGIFAANADVADGIVDGAERRFDHVFGYSPWDFEVAFFGELTFLYLV